MITETIHHLSEDLEYWLVPIFIIFLTALLALLFSNTYSKLVKRKSADINSDPTNYRFLGHAITALIYILGFSFAVYSVPSLKAVATSLLAGAGILAVVIGFASQEALSNVIAGVFIVLFKPYRIHDRVVIKDTMSGVVEDITLRHTVIRDFQNRRIIIPNSIIGNEVVVNSNYGDDQICKWLEIGISYDSDIDLAKAIITDEATKHPNLIDVRGALEKANNEPLVQIRVIELADSAVLLRAWLWAKDPASGYTMKCDLLESIKKRFDEQGVEIPFPHRTIVHKNMEFKHESAK